MTGLLHAARIVADTLCGAESDPRATRLGKVMVGLEEQILRLRANRCPTMGFGLEPEDIASAVASEVDEVRAEVPGSEAARVETAGVLATAIHLVLVHGWTLEEAVESERLRLQERLDLVERGYTWREAKVVQRFGEPAIRAWSAARDLVCFGADAVAAWVSPVGLEAAVFMEHPFVDDLARVSAHVFHVAQDRRRVQDYADEAQARGYVAALRFNGHCHELLAPR